MQYNGIFMHLAWTIRAVQPFVSCGRKCRWILLRFQFTSITPIAGSVKCDDDLMKYCCVLNSFLFIIYAHRNANDPIVKQQLDNPVYRVSGFGEFVGLHVHLHVETEHYLSYVNSYYGIKVLVNEPEDFPETSVSTVLVQPYFDVSISVIPSIVVSQDSIRNLPLRQRNCLFDDEVYVITDGNSFEMCFFAL